MTELVHSQKSSSHPVFPEHFQRNVFATAFWRHKHPTEKRLLSYKGDFFRRNLPRRNHFAGSDGAWKASPALRAPSPKERAHTWKDWFCPFKRRMRFNLFTAFSWTAPTVGVV